MSTFKWATLILLFQNRFSQPSEYGRDNVHSVEFGPDFYFIFCIKSLGSHSPIEQVNKSGKLSFTFDAKH